MASHCQQGLRGRVYPSIMHASIYLPSLPLFSISGINPTRPLWGTPELQPTCDVTMLHNLPRNPSDLQAPYLSSSCIILQATGVFLDSFLCMAWVWAHSVDQLPVSSLFWDHRHLQTSAYTMFPGASHTGEADVDGAGMCIQPIARSVTSYKAGATDKLST